jgi:hypothetical protein
MAIDRRLKILRGNAHSDLCQRFDILTRIPGVGDPRILVRERDGDNVGVSPRRGPAEIADVLCNDDAVLPEKAAGLIDEPDAIGDQATANPMNRLHSCSGDLTGTKRMFGRPTASQIASASFRSFLLDFT